jgi:hypothetical protein
LRQEQVGVEVSVLLVIIDHQDLKIEATRPQGGASRQGKNQTWLRLRKITTLISLSLEGRGWGEGEPVKIRSRF